MTRRIKETATRPFPAFPGSSPSGTPTLHARPIFCADGRGAHWGRMRRDRSLALPRGFSVRRMGR